MSCLIHALCGGILVLSDLQSLFSHKKIIASSIKVDLVGLPDKEAPDKFKKAAAKKPPQTPPPLRKKKPAKKAYPKKKVEKKPAPKPKKSSPEKSQTETAEKKKPVKGNQVQESGDLESRKQQEGIQIAYLEGVGQRIRANWGASETS